MFYDERRLVEYSAHILISGILMLESSCCFFVIAPKLKEIMAVFLEIIKDSPGVAEEVCDVICRLAEWYGCSETKHAIFEVEDQIVRLLLKVFDFGSPTVYVKAMRATGTFACAIGPEFCKHLPQFHGCLQKGLVNVEDHSVCSASIRVVGDLCCALDYKILPSSSVIMTLLNDYLCNGDLDRSFKPLIFSCFGNMALAIGSHFESSVPHVMYVMETAANRFAQTEDVNDKATVEYGKQLKQSIFKAYSGILQGCKRSNAEIMVPYVPEILDFIVGKDDANRDESVLQAAVAVLGDLAVALGTNVKEEEFKKQLAFCMEFLGECLKSEDKQLKETATWTHAVLGSKQLKETATLT
ncbi:putative armadillo-like helical, importin beta family [Helianthus annuus]|nr:putative armadillo-like helical, importin beta family [Helianthus annuus]